MHTCVYIQLYTNIYIYTDIYIYLTSQPGQIYSPTNLPPQQKKQKKQLMTNSTNQESHLATIVQVAVFVMVFLCFWFSFVCLEWIVLFGCFDFSVLGFCSLYLGLVAICACRLLVHGLTAENNIRVYIYIYYINIYWYILIYTGMCIFRLCVICTPCATTRTNIQPNKPTSQNQKTKKT